MFDADTLLSSDIEGATSTEYVPIPEGEYTGIINKIDAKEVTSKKDGQVYHFFEVTYIIDDEKVREVTGMDEPRARQSMILDFTDAGTLDLGKGKNVPLGRLREACNQNDPSKAWSFRMLEGQAVKVNVKHRSADDGTGAVYAEVKNVASL